jgi:protein-disulfide isomerase
MSKESGMTRREAQRQKMRRNKQRDRMKFIWIAVGLALVVAAVLVIPNLIPAGAVATPESAFTRTQVNGNAVGDPNAPIKLEEFSDFQCPYCARFSAQTEAQLVKAYADTGKVYFMYRSYGEFIGPESRAAAEAAYCAGDQGKFWEMHDMLFANQTGENIGDFTNKRLTTFAQNIGLDMGSFTSCFNGGTYSSRVDQDLTDGTAAGIKATPSFVMTYTVNGQVKSVLIEGAVPFSDFQAKFDAALAEMGVQ